MRHLALLILSLSLVSILIAVDGQTDRKVSTGPQQNPGTETNRLPATGPLDVCYAPGTPESYIQQVEQWQRDHNTLDFQMANRWSVTAHGVTGGQGNAIALTYSFVPDGLTLPSGAGEPNAGSNLFATLTAQFGSEQAWKDLFAQVFAEWSAVSGITYEEVEDDGASFGQQSPGGIGQRGDIRIGSHHIDGGGGVLAWDQMPNVSDMVLDSDENWAVPGQEYIFFRNIVAHEHGHGLGILHVCPVNQTKLLEPFYSPAFDGPQHDEIRAVQRAYGDPLEPNDDDATPSQLGVIEHDTTLNNLSIDDNSDIDYYSFTIAAGKGFSLALIPVGRPYLDGPQVQSGCTEGTQINSLDDQNLDLTLFNLPGTIQLAISNIHPAGETEDIYHYMPAAEGGSFLIQVSGGNADVVQIYKLQIEIFNLSDPYLSFQPLVFDTTLQTVPISRQVDLINPTNSALTVNTFTTTGPFSVLPNTVQVIAANSRLLLTVTYLATTMGTQTGMLTMNHDGTGGNTTCDLTGTAVSVTLSFVNGTNRDFGDVPLFTTDSAVVMIRALGNIPLTISSITTSDPFSMSLSSVELNSGQTLLLRPHFTPTELGLSEGMLIFVHSAPSSPDTVFLSGTGIPNTNTHDPEYNPFVFELGQNYPNPFNPATRITFSLAQEGQTSLRVFDLQGRLVRELINERMEAGQHSVDFNGLTLPSGLYICRLTSSGLTATQKMILLK